MTRAIIAIFGLLALAGCAAENTVTEQPAMYVNMADPAPGSMRRPRPR